MALSASLAAPAALLIVGVALAQLGMLGWLPPAVAWVSLALVLAGVVLSEVRPLEPGRRRGDDRLRGRAEGRLEGDLLPRDLLGALDADAAAFEKIVESVKLDGGAR